MADVFISYSREDRLQAEHIARGLSAMGLEVFWDNEIPPGQTWADYIEGKLAQCNAVIVLWSQHSVKSQWVREEARMGREKAKLIPALLDGAPAPFGFGEVQAADLSRWRGEPNHPDWNRFAQAVYAIARGEGATPPAQPPQSQPQQAWSPPPPPAAAAAWSQSAEGAPEQLSPIGYIQKCLRLYANGKGRARRAEYWWWTLFAVAVSLVATLIDLSFGTNAYTGEQNSEVISMVASLALLAPGVSVTARRFHDVGLSGWLVAAFVGAYFLGGFLAGFGGAMGNPGLAGLGGIIFIVAGVAQLVIALIPSRPGANQYGPNPKGV